MSSVKRWWPLLGVLGVVALAIVVIRNEPGSVPDKIAGTYSGTVAYYQPDRPWLATEKLGSFLFTVHE